MEWSITSGSRVNFPAKTSELVGTGVTEFGRRGDQFATETLRRLADEGVDTVAAVRASRERSRGFRRWGNRVRPWRYFGEESIEAERLPSPAFPHWEERRGFYRPRTLFSLRRSGALCATILADLVASFSLGSFLAGAVPLFGAGVERLGMTHCRAASHPPRTIPASILALVKREVRRVRRGRGETYFARSEFRSLPSRRYSLAPGRRR